MGREVPRDLGNEVAIQGSAGRDRGADSGPASADMPGAGWGDCSGGGVTGSRSHVGECAAAVGSGQAGAVHEGAVEPYAAGRISAVEEALLGLALVGARVLLCERGGGG